MAINDLNTVLRGIVASFLTKGVDNNYLVDSKGKILKSSGKEIHLWNNDMFQMPFDQFFCFQPFNELATHEDSPALSYLRRMINTEMNVLLQHAIPAVYLASINLKTPNKRQQEIFGGEMGAVDEKSINFMEKVLEKAKLNHRTESIVDVTLYNSNPISREADGSKYAVLKSPLLNELAYWSSGDKIMGVAVPNKKVVAQLRQALQALLPKDWESGMYIVSNKHRTIPRNLALHDVYSDIIDSVSHVADTLKMKDLKVPSIHEDWTSGLQRVGTLLQGIPRDVYGTLGKVRAGHAEEAAQEETGRLNITGGFGANPNANQGIMNAPTAPVTTGGILGQMQANANAAQAPAGYVLVPATAMGIGQHTPTMPGLFGQPTQTQPQVAANAPVVPGGILGQLK